MIIIALIRLFLFMLGLFLLISLFSGALLWLKLRKHILNPFQRPAAMQKPPPPPPGIGEIIEGDYKVVDEKDR